MTAPTSPWWEALKLREEIASAAGAIRDVQMSLHDAVYGHAGKEVPYTSPTYYGQITYPTSGLVDLMAAVALRLGSSSGVETARAVWRADQAMGGGKSHGLIGLWHLATNPEAFRQTDIGKAVWSRAETIAGAGVLADSLDDPHVVVLSCDNMTPGKPDPDVDGPAHTLGERFLWRLFNENNALYKQYRHDVGNKAKLADAIDTVGRPVLILIDEILDYVRTATAEAENDLAVKDMAFLRALFETVAKSDRCVLVLVMIASHVNQVAMSNFGERCRDELEGLLVRNGKTTTVTSGADFAEIIRRRLFDGPPPAHIPESTIAAYKHHMGGPWADIFARQPWGGPVDFEREARRSYPFHPSLIRLAEKEWSRYAGFQEVRSTLQIFAATAWALQDRVAKGGWAPFLIGPGDVPLSNHDAREAILGSGIIEASEAAASFREIAKNDVVADDDERGNARQIDVGREPSPFANSNPRAAERVATALFLYSLAPRGQGHRGATESELKAAGFVPADACTVADVDAVVAALRDNNTGLASLDEIPGKGGQERRLLLSTRQTLNMFYRAERSAVTDDERDQVLATRAEALMSSGPFRIVRFVSAADHNLNELKDQALVAELVNILAGAGIDEAHTTRLLVLDPRAFTLLNGQDAETKDAVEAAFGLGSRKDRLAVMWASSCVFAVVNTQRRAQARGLATEYLAWQRVGGIDAVASDEALAAQAKQEAKEVLAKLDQRVRAAYRHVAYVDEETREDGSRTRVVRYRRFDKENHTALDGSLVWADLDQADKAFAPGTFDVKALLNNLREQDWGLPLSEIRAAFYNTPRLPLLPGGDADLRDAIFEGYRNGDLIVVTPSGQEAKAVRPGDINLSSTSLRLEKPKPTDAVTVPDLVGQSYEQVKSACDALGLVVSGGGAGAVLAHDPRAGYEVEPGSTITLTMSGDGGGELPPGSEIQVGIALMGLTLDDQTKRDNARLLFDALGDAVDSEASHIVVNLKVVVPSDQASDIRTRATELGAHVTETEL